MAGDGDEALLSLALPIEGFAPLLALPQLAEQESLQVLWDSAPGLCLAAAGPCQELELAGSRRFEQAQRFADLCRSRFNSGKGSKVSARTMRCRTASTSLCRSPLLTRSMPRVRAAA